MSPLGNVALWVTGGRNGTQQVRKGATPSRASPAIRSRGDVTHPLGAVAPGYRLFLRRSGEPAVPDKPRSNWGFPLAHTLCRGLSKVPIDKSLYRQTPKDVLLTPFEVGCVC